MNTKKNNFWPVSNDHWNSQKSKHNVMFTVSLINKNQIFAVNNVIENNPLTWNIVWNKENSLLYFIEKNKLWKLIDAGLFDQVDNIDFPDNNEIIK